MKVRIRLDVGEYERFVIAKFFHPAGQGRDGIRLRATRAQVQRYVRAAIRRAVDDQAREMAGRSRAAARRLKDGVTGGVEPLPEPTEQQRDLQW